MILIIAAILFVLWVIGLLTSMLFGGWLHVLLAIAIILLIVRIVRGGAHA